MTAGDRKVFAPIPARALRDQRLSGLQLRLLGAIAMFDRMGRNGQGCWAGNERLAEFAGCAYTSVSTELGRLREYGYVTTERHATNQRRLVHRVVYNAEDARSFRARNSSANAEPFARHDSSAHAEPSAQPDSSANDVAQFGNHRAVSRQ